MSRISEKAVSLLGSAAPDEPEPVPVPSELRHPRVLLQAPFGKEGPGDGGGTDGEEVPIPLAASLESFGDLLRGEHAPAALGECSDEPVLLRPPLSVETDGRLRVRLVGVAVGQGPASWVQSCAQASGWRGPQVSANAYGPPVPMRSRAAVTLTGVRPPVNQASDFHPASTLHTFSS